MTSKKAKMSKYFSKIVLNHKPHVWWGTHNMCNKARVGMVNWLTVHHKTMLKSISKLPLLLNEADIRNMLTKICTQLRLSFS